VDSSEAKLGWSLEHRNPAAAESFLAMFGWFYQHYFRVQTNGWHHIPQQEPVLFVGSHNGGLSAPDMVMTIYDWYQRFGYERPVYGLMHPHMWKVLPAPLAQTAAQLGPMLYATKSILRGIGLLLN
jgi:1-acyl-sn-glycerol-3-phosphate acyltransferase